jgi:hypothetical protein
MGLSLHVPIQSALGAQLHATLQASGKAFQPFPSIFFVEAEDKAIPVCDFDPFETVAYAFPFFFGRYLGSWIVWNAIIFGIVIGNLGTEQVMVLVEFLQLLEPPLELFINARHSDAIKFSRTLRAVVARGGRMNGAR